MNEIKEQTTRELEAYFQNQFMILLDRVPPSDKYQLETMYEIAKDLDISPWCIRLEGWDYEELNGAIDYTGSPSLKRHLQTVLVNKDYAERGVVFEDVEWKHYEYNGK